MAGSDAYFLDLDTAGGSPWVPEERALPEANALWDTQTEALVSLGVRVGPYEVHDLLGKGAMAVVFAGRHAETREPVAIKVLKQQAPERARERFRREAVVMSSLRHENIVGIRLCGIMAARPFVVLERLEGGTVRQLLERTQSLPIERALRIAVDALRGLSAAHALSVVHRDVKPENLLLDASGKAKVADFGLVKLTDSSDAMELTQEGHAVGTPLYMSPEQAAAGDLTGVSDVYSMGLVLYEMLAGVLPSFGGQTLIECLHRRHDAPAPRVRHERVDVPEDVDEALAAMLQAQADDRPSAHEAARLLEVALSNLVGAAPPFRRLTVALLWSGQVRFLELAGDGAELVLGRSARVDVTIDDERASRRHCVLRATPAGLLAVDLGSTNGSWVRGMALGADPLPVPSGSTLRVADTDITVLWCPVRGASALAMV